MKPFEILSALPQWAKLDAEAIVDSPAFAMPCRLGEESTTLVLGATPPADALSLSEIGRASCRERVFRAV